MSYPTGDRNIRMTKFKAMGVLLGGLALLGAGCGSGGSAEVYAIVDKDPVAAVNAYGYYDEVQQVGRVKTLVRPSDIHRSGQGVDGIPVLTAPFFVTVDEAETEGVLIDEFYGISVKDGETRKFYPLQILAWHEIVHDTMDGAPIIVTYSPLTEATGVYRADGAFGVSGYVWNNESLMYDEATKTLWSRLIGRGAYGSQAGRDLSTIPFELVPWEKWREAYPEGRVLSTQTGYARRYDRSPYGGYLLSRNIFFPMSQPFVAALEPKAVVSGIVVEGIAKAYQEGPVAQNEDGLKQEKMGETNIVVWVDEARGVLRAHEAVDVDFRSVDGEDLMDRARNRWTLDEDGNLIFGDRVLRTLVPQTMFWFGWSSLHPDSHLYGNVRGKGLVDGPFEIEEGEGVDLNEDNEIKVDASFGAEATETEAQ